MDKIFVDIYWSTRKKEQKYISEEQLEKKNNFKNPPNLMKTINLQIYEHSNKQELNNHFFQVTESHGTPHKIDLIPSCKTNINKFK